MPSFLEDLIDAGVMECDDREHMAERDLLFHDTLAPHLAAYAPEASEAQQRDFLISAYLSRESVASVSGNGGVPPLPITTKPSPAARPGNPWCSWRL